MKILLADAAFSAVPILQALQQMGHEVWVCGGRPQDPGHLLAHGGQVLDYSDAAALKRFFESGQFDVLVPGCTDKSYIACAQVAHDLGGLVGLDTPQTTHLLQDKSSFRGLCQAQNYPSPKFVSDMRQIEELNFPVMLKPTSSFSGRGIHRVESKLELKTIRIRHPEIDRIGEYVAEEFVQGQLHSHSVMLRQQSISWDCFVNEYCSVYPYQVNSSHVSTRLSQEVIHASRMFVTRIAQDLQLVDGLLHVQFLTDGQSYHVVELTRRCPGDLYSLLVEFSTGVQYAKYYAQGYLPGSPLDITSSGVQAFVTRHTVSSDTEIMYKGSGLKGDFSKQMFVPLKLMGQILLPAPSDRAGIFFVWHEHENAMNALTPYFRERVEWL